MNRDPTKEDIQMANKHMKRCSTIYVTGEVQIKTRYHYTLIRIVKIQKIGNTKCWRGVEKQDLSFTAGRTAKW